MNPLIPATDCLVIKKESQIEGEMTPPEPLWSQGPEGRPLNVSPARKGWVNQSRRRAP
jgi:hypothetical protein